MCFGPFSVSRDVLSVFCDVMDEFECVLDKYGVFWMRFKSILVSFGVF